MPSIVVAILLCLAKSGALHKILRGENSCDIASYCKLHDFYSQKLVVLSIFLFSTSQATKVQRVVLRTTAMASSEQSVGVAPAPPGQVANFVSPVTRKGDKIALHTVMLFFVTISGGTRLYTRHFITNQLGLDDCKESLSLSLSYANTLERRFLGARIYKLDGAINKRNLTPVIS